MTTQAEFFWSVVEQMDDFKDQGRESYWKTMNERGVSTPIRSSQTYEFTDGSAVVFGTTETSDTIPSFTPARRSA